MPAYRLAVYARDGKLAITHPSSSLAAARGLAAQLRKGGGAVQVERWNGAGWEVVPEKQKSAAA